MLVRRVNPRACACGEWRVLRELRETANPAARPIAPQGRGRTILLVPGLLAPDLSMVRLARWLSASGWQVEHAGIGLNIGCSPRLVDHLARRLEGATCAAAVGQSRGGLLARALAIQRPELVSTVVALGSPICDQLATGPLVRAQLEVLARMGSWGVPGLMSHRCRDGPCCGRFRTSLSAPPPNGARLLSIWSASDGAVDPKACRDSHADCYEVDTSHIGMGFSRRTGSCWPMPSTTVAHARAAEHADRPATHKQPRRPLLKPLAAGVPADHADTLRHTFDRLHMAAPARSSPGWQSIIGRAPGHGRPRRAPCRRQARRRAPPHRATATRPARPQPAAAAAARPYAVELTRL
jgi:triacylglycerol lipase